ncbi:hypothetical protein N0V88_001696 [Collariella sp. IMI 366227]|nr:hypothetical protein N0V88_001696 [Collariella sp. IMI 366227]
MTRSAASHKEPVQLEPVFPDDGEIDDDTAHLNSDEEAEEDDDDEYPTLSVKPRPRRHHLPPMPDLRFEQSYLRSIQGADTWWKVGWITARDQVMMPFVQGVLYNLAICGWQSYNRNARIHGSSVGARLRRWWYGVNNWAVPPERKAGMKKTTWR